MKKILYGLTLLLFLANQCFAETDQIKDIFNSVVKVKHNLGLVSDLGTGNCINQDETYIYIITNHHVAGDVNNVCQIFFYKDGHESAPIDSKVIWTAYRITEPVDISILKVEKSKLGGWIPNIIQFEYDDKPLKVGDACLTIGCPKAKWPEAKRGHIAKSSNGMYYITPDVVEGQSGSVLFNKDGSKAIGLIAWSSEGYGKAMNTQTIQNAVFGKKSNYYFKQPYSIKDKKQVKFTDAESVFGGGRFKPNDDCPDGNCPSKPKDPTTPPTGGNKIFPTSPEQKPENPDIVPEAPKDPPKPSELELYKKEVTDKFTDLDGRLGKIETNINSSENSRQNLLSMIAKLEGELKSIGTKVEGIPSKDGVVTPGKLEETIQEFNKILENQSSSIGDTINNLEKKVDDSVSKEKMEELLTPIKKELTEKLVTVDDAQNKITNLNKLYESLKLGVSDIKSTTEKVSETNNTVIKEVLSGQSNDKLITIGGYSVPWAVVLILGWLYRRHFGGAATPPFPTIVPKKMKM